MQSEFCPNILKAKFSRKAIQLRALAALVNSCPNKNYKIFLLTPGGKITGDFCELYCTDDSVDNRHGEALDTSRVDELSDKVLKDAEDELVNIDISDNGEFIKLMNVVIENNGQKTELKQLNIYADQVIGFSIIEE